MEYPDDVWFLILAKCKPLEWVCCYSVSTQLRDLVTKMPKLKMSGRKELYAFCYQAARKNFLSVLQYLRKYDYYWNGMTPWSAVNAGYYDTLLWCIENGCPIYYAVVPAVVKSGNVHIMSVLFDNGELEYNSAHSNSKLCRITIENNDLPMLQYFHHTCSIFIHDDCCLIARYGHLDMLKYFHEDFGWLPANIDLVAIRYGQVHILEYLKDEGLITSPNPIDEACKYNQLKVIQYFYGLGIELTVEVREIAVSNNCMNIVEWLDSLEE
jgi:hypothetical protein